MVVQDVEQPQSEAKDDDTNHYRCSCASINLCCKHPRTVELYTSADYWSVWFGLIFFGITSEIVFVVIPQFSGANDDDDGSDNKRIGYVVPQ